MTAEAVKAVRQMTGAGIMACKTALEESNGEIAAAVEVLRKKGVARGIALADRKKDAGPSQGVVEGYIHPGGRIGAMVELNCETDFVARTEEFKVLAHNLAMQVAAMAPQFVGVDDLPPDFQGSLEDASLWHQAFIRDQSRSIQDVVAEAMGKLGEKIRVRRFSRFELGS